MNSIAQNISNKFNNNGMVFFTDSDDVEISIVELCDEVSCSKDKEDNHTVFYFEDDSRLLICDSFWTNKDSEIEEFLSFGQNQRYDSFSMESLDLNWNMF